MDAGKESVNGGGGIGLNNTRNNNNKSGKFGRNANSSGGSQGAGAGTVVIGGYMDTGKADRTMWLMKCPPVVSRSLQPAPPPPALMGYGDGGSGGNGPIPPPPPPSRPVAKVILSFDPLRSHEDNSTEVNFFILICRYPKPSKSLNVWHGEIVRFSIPKIERTGIT